MAVASGPVPDDAALPAGLAAGTSMNPVIIGALADDTSPDSVDEGDAGRLAMTLARELYVTPKKRGAGAVLSIFDGGSSNSSARRTIVTPTSGKAIRIISFNAALAEPGTTANHVELYFSTGTNISTTPGKAVGKLSVDDLNNGSTIVWPDGGGPVGAVDDVLSVRNATAVVGETGQTTVQYREE